MEKKKYCPQCGTELDEDDAVCFNCGAHQTKTIEAIEAPKEKEENVKIRCRRCGALFSPDNKTCPICGASNKDRIVSSEPVPAKKANPNTIKDTAPEDAFTVSAGLGILSIILSFSLLFGLVFGVIGSSRAKNNGDQLLCKVGIILTIVFAFVWIIVLIALAATNRR